MRVCPKCGSALKKDIENVYEIDENRYFDLTYRCDSCGFQKPVTISRKSTVPKAKDPITEMTASLKLREYMPERKETPSPQKKSGFQGVSFKKAFNPFKHTKELFIYGGAILLGVIVEIAGLYFEGYLRALQVDPLIGFIINLLIFVFGPIIIVGSAVYYVTRDRLKAILLGSMAVPLTIILLAKLRLETWGV